MSWQGRNGIQVWVGDDFPEPDDIELLDYGYHPRYREGAKTVRQPAACSTDSGYYRHRRNGERPCDPCRHAHNAVRRERKRRKRQEQRRLQQQGVAA